METRSILHIYSGWFFTMRSLFKQLFTYRVKGSRRVSFFVENTGVRKDVLTALVEFE